MKGLRRTRAYLILLILPGLLMPPSTTLAGIFGEKKAPLDGPVTLQQAAAWVDQIDRRLFEAGLIGVKTPDVWGQNRMTVYRAEFESQMQTRLGSYQNILQAAQSRTDVAALTSATSLGATVAAAKSGKSSPFAAFFPRSFNVNSSPSPAFLGAFPSGALVVNASATPTASLTPPPPTPSSPAGPTPADPGNPGFADMAAQLAAIAARIDKLKEGALTLPTGINTYVNTAGKTGVGIEPTIQLDEEADYINHLHQLRRVNAGDDLTDMAGYGLYLLRMPVSLMPGPESRKGKGASVTVEARHDLKEDLLPNTLRDVAILDLTYALTQIVNEDIHQAIYDRCHHPMPKKPADGKQAKDKDTSQSDPPKNVAGPSPHLLEDLRTILGPFKEATDQDIQKEKKLGDEEDDDASAKQWRYSQRRYDRILSDRLETLVDSMRAAQSDPFRHDPSTLTLFQASLMDAYRFMRENANRVDLFQVPKIEALGEMLLRRDYKQLKQAREMFFRQLYCFRQGWPIDAGLPLTWADEVEPSDILAFALLLQYVNVDRTLKWDMKYMSQRRGCNCGDVDGLFFYEFEPSQEARNAFKDYVACKWPLHIYSVDPMIDQQNVLDAYSRRTELQLALAVGVATGQTNIKNATSFARQLDLDLQTVGLNRTSVGFGAGDTTFGWMFYPRVQTPHPVSNFRTFTNTLTGTGQGPNFDLRSRRIEPGQRDCIALMVTPNFIPSIQVSTVANWFDVTGLHAKQQLNNQEMLELSRKLQQAKAAVTQVCDSHQYRATDFAVLNQRIKQLEALLPTQDTRVDLPDEGDLHGSEIFSSNAAGLSPALLAWYGETIQDGKAGSIFLQGRGFSVSETQVIVGGMPLHQGTEFRLISRNVMQIIVPANARSVKVQLDPEEADPTKPADPKTAVATLTSPPYPTIEAKGGVAQVQAGTNMAHAALDPNLDANVNVTLVDGNSTANVQGARVDVKLGDMQAHAEAAPKEEKKALPCDRAVIDVHIATPNGISNHLYVEVVPKEKPPTPKNAVTTATTTTTVHGNTMTTSTKFETTPPGTVLPPLTVLPMGTAWPPGTMLAPGPVTGAPAGSLLPGIVPTPTPPAVTPLSLLPPATPAPTTTPAPGSTMTAPPPPASGTPAPAAPAIPSGVAAPPSGMPSGVAAPPGPRASLDLPPLPPDPPKVVAAPSGTPTTKRVRPPLLRRIGLPDR